MDFGNLGFRSLGGAVATQLASQPWCAKQAMCLVLENTFTSLPDIGRHIFDIRPIHYIPNCAYKNRVCLMVSSYLAEAGLGPGTNRLYESIGQEILLRICDLFQYPTKDRVQRITLPTLFMSGLADTLIPPTMMQQLYDVSCYFVSININRARVLHR